jgi:hypothetical protein
MEPEYSSLFMAIFFLKQQHLALRLDKELPRWRAHLFLRKSFSSLEE